MSLNHQSRFSLFLWSVLVLGGCVGLSTYRDTTASSSDQGGGSAVIQLPVAEGRELMCTQGAHGSHSHQSESTQYDIDLDTSNSVDEEVFSPVSGKAYVHRESATSGFGYHVNIELSDGTYVVIGHMDDIFLTDGQEVAEGTIMGYEGCTGNCSGDHIHIGLHEGDASLTADNGVSIPAVYWTADASEYGSAQTITSEEFVCGIRSEGDAQDGHFYESELAVNLWHPDGTLIKTPDNARVYVLEDGNTRWIENESTFWGLGYDFADVTLVSDEELSCYGKGSDMSGEVSIDAGFDVEGDLWLILGSASDPDRYRVHVRGDGWEHVMASWGLDYGLSNWPDTYGDSASYMTDWPPSASYMGLRDGTIVKEEDASDVWVISGGYALPVQSWDVYLLMSYFPRSILTVEDGIVGELHLLGNCATDQMCIDFTAVTSCGGGMDISGGPGVGGDSDWNPNNEEEHQEEEQDDAPVEEEEEVETAVSVLTVEVDYPANYPELTLTVQPIFAVSSLGDYWSASVEVTSDDEVSWSEEGDYSGLLGVRFNVNVDSDGDGTADDWYCYGHYSSAFLEYGVAVEITLDADSWDENDLVMWSPGESSDTSLGCSALLWFGSTSSIVDGHID
ncbi:M23 family metallopeptidase [Candidatus Uhrbacteria bacterium]|nr:M23 family metallopeptidase [Candidatus Uhrbacteria bacterium]